MGWGGGGTVRAIKEREFDEGGAVWWVYVFCILGFEVCFYWCGF